MPFPILFTTVHQVDVEASTVVVKGALYRPVIGGDMCKNDRGVNVRVANREVNGATSNFAAEKASSGYAAGSTDVQVSLVGAAVMAVPGAMMTGCFL